jgi:ribosomal protein L30E
MRRKKGKYRLPSPKTVELAKYKAAKIISRNVNGKPLQELELEHKAKMDALRAEILAATDHDKRTELGHKVKAARDEFQVKWKATTAAMKILKI